MSLDQVLVETEVFIQKPKRRFDALGDLIDLSGLQTLVVNSMDAEHAEEMSGLGEKRVFIDGFKNANVGVQRARFLIVFQNAPESNHWRLPFPSEMARFAGSYRDLNLDAFSRIRRSCGSVAV